MAVDWGFAGQIGVAGVAIVFGVLIILALAIWLIGLVISRTNTSKVETGDNKKKGE